ncbi:rod-binding protein [Vibrio mimicus]
MKFNNVKDQAQLNSMLYYDNNALATIKHSSDKQGSLEVAAGQFEAMFLQMVLRQMRSSSDVLADKNSPFSSQQQGVFRDMYDGQLSLELARKQNSGIANMLVQQLRPSIREMSFETSRGVLPANDETPSPLTISESKSQLDTEDGEMSVAVINSPQHAVASIQQVLGEAGMTTAFTQPLNKKMGL